MDITYTFMIPVLEFFAEWLHSYGWAIVALTLSIRVVVWPLVASSTRSMQRMAQLQPKFKELQQRYKDDPQMFQQKAMEFYKNNKASPVGGCLPTLVQLPILFALFATFTGPPFQDKGVPVKVNLIDPAHRARAQVNISQTSGHSSAYVSKEGQLARVVVHPGDSTLIFGETAEGHKTPDSKNTLHFSVSAVEGVLPADFQPKWRIAHDPRAASVNHLGQATFPEPGEVVVAAFLPDGQEVPVGIKVLPRDAGGGLGWFAQEDPFKEKTIRSRTEVATILDGQQVKVAITPGESTLVAGGSAQFKLTAVEGQLPADFRPLWKIADDPNAARIDAEGHAVFPRPGEVTVEAVIPGVAKDEPFYFINSIGKVARGMELFQPANWDVLSMILMFGITMYLSQKLMASPTTHLDPEQAAIQRQTMQTMPIAITAMFFFIPLPAGVYLYMVISNVVQSLQTWIIMRTPPPDMVDVSDGDGEGGQVIDVTPGDSGDGKQKTIKLETKRRAKKKK